MRTGIRVLTIAAACAIVTVFRAMPNAELAFVFSAAAAVLVAGWSAWTAWGRSGRWLAVALLGQAAALQLIDAGTRIHYQHYRLPAEAAADPVLRWMLLLVALQALLVGSGLLRRRTAISAWLSGRRLAMLAAAVAVCGSVAAAVSRDPRYYAAEVSLGAFIEIVNLGNLVLFAWSLPASRLKRAAQWIGAVLGDRDSAPVSPDRFVWLAAVWVTAVSALLAWFVYQRHPHIADEVVYLYHARYFAAGEVVMPPPPVAPAFEVDLMEYRPDKWYAVPPMGWPAVLAVGVFVGVPWLVNPVLAGLNVVLIYLLAGELYPRRIARMAVILSCVSPWNVFLAMSYMNHTLTMTCTLAAFLGVARARRAGPAGWAAAAGVGIGFLSLIRPLDALIVGALAGAWAIGIGGKRLPFRALASLAIAAAITGAITLPYNRALVGRATASPIMRYLDEHYHPNANAYGFGPDRGMGWPTDAYPGHTPFESLINDELNGSALNVDLFGWSTGSLALIAVLIFAGGLRRTDYLMLAAMGAVVLAYMPYWGNGGGDFGARYWYIMLLPCLALTARGTDWLENRLGPVGGNGTRAVAAVAALCAMALVNYFPWRSLDKYYHYLRMRPDVQELARSHDFGRSLVLVRGERFPDYASAAVYNPIDLKGDGPVYAWDRSPEVRAEVLKAYTGRPVWILEGPSITQAGYRIVAGPSGPRP